MSLQILVQGGLYGSGFDQTISAAAEAALQDQEISSGTLTIVLTDEPGICEYNRRFAGIDQPTDVLSFPAGEIDPETGSEYIGDVIVCPPIALTGAAMGRHALLSELCLLTVHGVLHLLHYDHDNEENRARMWEAQARILRRLGDPVEGSTDR
ncbi:MAG: rRNA maturation RNase YbeY [Anaerolineales bacterium]